MSKLKWLAVLLACLLAGAGVAVVASIIIRSPTITITVEDYALTINANATTCITGETINFTGTLTTDSFIIENQNISLYYSNDTYTGLSDFTDANGFYTIIWTATTNLSFYTQAEIT